MSLRTIASFVFAIFLGLIAMVMVRGYLNRQAPVAQDGKVAAGSTGVVVAAAPIARGAAIDAAMLKIVSYPAGNVPAGAFTDIAQVAGAGPNARVSLRALVADEPVLSARVSAPGAKGGLSGTLAPGMRAIGVKSSDVAGVGGFVLPGDRVDVLVTRQVQSGDSVTQVLAQNVRVLGVDQTDDMDSDKPMVAKAVTVEVTPDEAQAISLAQSVGSVALSLRQYADETPLLRRTMTVSDFGGVAARATPAVLSSSRPMARRASAGRTQGQPSARTVSVKVTRGVETAEYSVGSE